MNQPSLRLVKHLRALLHVNPRITHRGFIAQIANSLISQWRWTCRIPCIALWSLHRLRCPHHLNRYSASLVKGVWFYSQYL